MFPPSARYVGYKRVSHLPPNPSPPPSAPATSHLQDQPIFITCSPYAFLHRENIAPSSHIFLIPRYTGALLRGLGEHTRRRKFINRAKTEVGVVEPQRDARLRLEDGGT